jgi:hypothetical protein
VVKRKEKKIFISLAVTLQTVVKIPLNPVISSDPKRKFKH